LFPDSGKDSFSQAAGITVQEAQRVGLWQTWVFLRL
jgi:hypothetical protein